MRLEKWWLKLLVSTETVFGEKIWKLHILRQCYLMLIGVMDLANFITVFF